MAGVKKELKAYRMAVVRARYEEEGSVPIAKDLGITRSGVLRMAKAMKLKYKDQRKKSAIKRQISNTTCNYNYFKTWSPNMAYALGYIYADGCINKSKTAVMLLCHSKDEEIIVQIHKEMDSKHHIGRRPAKTYGGRNNGPRTYCNFSSMLLVKDLIELHGVRPGKTKLDLPLPNIPDEYFGHFFRGFIDGDGHISVPKEGSFRKFGRVSFVATPTFAEQLMETLIRLVGVERKTPCVQKTIVSVEWAKSADLLKLYKLIYPEGSYIYLKRKKLAFDQVMYNIATKSPFRKDRKEKYN